MDLNRESVAKLEQYSTWVYPHPHPCIKSSLDEESDRRKQSSGSSHCSSVETNQNSIREEAGSIPGPLQWVKDSALLRAVVWVRRCGSDLALLWLWCTPAAIALIWPLAWEFPYAPHMPPPQKKERKKIEFWFQRNRLALFSTATELIKVNLPEWSESMILKMICRSDRYLYTVSIREDWT